MGFKSGPCHFFEYSIINGQSIVHVLEKNRSEKINLFVEETLPRQHHCRQENVTIYWNLAM